MEKDKIKLNEFIENPEHYFVLLKPTLETRNDIHIIEINVQGYRDLFCMIMDLLKTAKFALDGIEVSTESTINTERYVGSLLRIIEMLIPLEEAELLDMLYIKYLNEKNKSDFN
ncbi:hypothetical protein [Flavobacterium sp. FPG59]|jgi:hypothetical protein|uniref:hypothetical protein n=1 Tax=Flavobacterium sp. FPG59 TaxID=1929267 RepID=UPI000A3C74CC|nr:hypothetical protein [Flavobacterium sp. FPG59]OUD35812.1 hypothetical protein FPG59_08980 [Flavobacterium sp. FPG59]